MKKPAQTKQLNVRIPAELYSATNAAAVKLGQPLTYWVTAAIQRHLGRVK